LCYTLKCDYKDTHKGVNTVGLEEEALNYSKGKEQVFVEDLTKLCENLDNYIVKHIAPCHERNHVMQSVREVYLWARYCSELNGVK